MTTLGMLRPFRLIISTLPVLLLCACAGTLPSSGVANAPKSAAQAQAARTSKTPSDDAKTFALSEEITPASSLEKNQLSVSYTLRPIPGGNEQLLRLTLIFRSSRDTYRHIHPHVTLVDAKGNAIRHYSMKEFVSMPSRSKWADMYWLKPSFRIPPNGLVIGDLVYHCKQANFPMKLSLRIDKDSFDFTAD